MKNKMQYAKQATICNDIVFEDSELKLTKIYNWNIKIYKEKNTGVYVADLEGENTPDGKSTFVSEDGKLLTDLVFNHIGGYEDEMWKVCIKGQGYGFLDKNLDIAVPLKYKEAQDFCNGYACVHNGEQWIYVDKKGNEIMPEKSYAKTEDFSDGLARVSTVVLSHNDLAYHSILFDDAGIWGYIDLTGKEVIKPQYIYAFDFLDDRAIVVKKNRECNKNRAEKQLWGVIDKNGNEIIPCIYDEIREIINDDDTLCEDYYQVHVGGLEKGKWAIIDRNGIFVTEPVFEDAVYSYYKGLYTFKNKTSELTGIYDLNEKKVLFEPQFDEVTFLDNGNILVTSFNKDFGYKVAKVIDKTGKEVFKSEYTSIDTSNKPWMAIKESENSIIYNLIDENGNILDGNEFSEKILTPYWYHPINFETRTYIYSENNKFGLKKFNGEIIVPAQYEKIHNFIKDRHFYYYEAKKYSDKKGLMKYDGTIVLNPQYEYIGVLDDNKIIALHKNGTEIYSYEFKKEEKC